MHKDTPSGKDSESGRGKRDPRIDLFRGLALIAILIDHLGDNVFLGPEAALFKLTPRNWGLSGSAEIFVFLSGLVYGLAYRPLFEREFGLGCKRSLLRAWQLYVINMFLFAIVLGLSSEAYLSETGDRVAHIPVLQGLWVDPWQAFARMCLLDPPIPYFDILVLYVRMLLVAPLFCRLLMLRPALALGASFVVYSLAQLGWLKVGHSFANVYA